MDAFAKSKMTITDWLQSLCDQTTYCLVYSEFENALTSFLLAVVFAGAFGYLILVQKLDGKKNELAKLKDDIFDVVLLRIYGMVMLALVAATWKWQHESVQMDAMVFEVVLSLTALVVNNNTMAGLFFVALSYSSWYGWFRLLMITPLGSDFHLLVRPQWIAALLAFTAPMLISNLKYPSLLDTDMAKLCYGLTLFGAIMAAHAGLVLFDLIVVSYDLFPGHAQAVMSGAYFRMYGTTAPMTRLMYIAAMAVLQYITCLAPHYLTNKADLQNQLLEQEADKKDIDQDTDFAPTGRNTPSSGSNTSGGTSAPADIGAIDLTDIPGDCVEISTEEAIEMQERSIRAREAAAASAVEAGDREHRASGISQRKKPSTAER